MQLNDLDFADDLARLSHTQQQMQEKTTSVATTSVAVGLNIHKGKSRIRQYNTARTNPITLDGEDLEDVITFTYLSSIIDEYGGSDADVKARIGKARGAYLQLKNIWNSKQLSTNIKVRNFNTNVNTVLLYGAKPGELRKPSSRRYRCLLTVVYAKYFGSVGQTLLVTTNCGKEQTTSQRRNKSGGNAGSGYDTHWGKHPTASQDKSSHGILKTKGGEEDQRTHYAGKWR
ncbi:unnamed protein product [Schistosoma curassoni]|uniref:DUF6451 domain-containing protein n=1 Tax=Schistosoma curassoni TaxID=6186 RepID=A0A183KK75_9TREM|nr:unnamed protein product [Schistosoma curassoni]